MRDLGDGGLLLSAALPSLRAPSTARPTRPPAVAGPSQSVPRRLPASGASPRGGFRLGRSRLGGGDVLRSGGPPRTLRVPRARTAEGVRVVIGGGRATGFPRHPPETITINPDVGARPDIRAIGQQLPLAPGCASDILIERLPYNLLQGQPGRQMFAEAHRTLRQGGTLRGITGEAADWDSLREALRAVGFRRIHIWQGDVGVTEFSAVK
jgi:hypothetical protein